MSQARFRDRTSVHVIDCHNGYRYYSRPVQGVYDRCVIGQVCSTSCSELPLFTGRVLFAMPYGMPLATAHPSHKRGVSTVTYGTGSYLCDGVNYPPTASKDAVWEAV